MNNYIITFFTVTDALYFEKLSKNKMSVRLINVPRKLSTSCGYALEVQNALSEDLESLLEMEQAFYQEVFLVENGDYKMIVDNS